MCDIEFFNIKQSVLQRLKYGFALREHLVADWPYHELNVKCQQALDELIEAGEVVEIEFYSGNKYKPYTMLFPKDVQFPHWSLAELQKHSCENPICNMV